MGTYRTPYIEAGALVVKELEKTFATLRYNGCTVTYDKQKGFLHTLYTDVRIEGPDEWIRAFDKWVKEND